MSLSDDYTDLTKAMPKGIDDYTLTLRASVRGLWAGKRTLFGFVDNTVSAINRHMENAWREGAAECGMRPGDRTPDEQIVLDDFVNNQVKYLPEFGQFIVDNSKENKGKLRTSLNRLPLWINRYNELRGIAKTMACGDAKLVWRLGDSEHCRTCLKLSGRVMRASRWRELDVYPQDTRPDKLDCHGYNCKCYFQKTNKPATPGKFPRLP